MNNDAGEVGSSRQQVAAMPVGRVETQTDSVSKTESVWSGLVARLLVWRGRRSA